MKYIILDLEATCWKERPKDKQMEIIEIGAVCINEQGEQESEFCAFVKPILNPALSPFCKELTTIRQEDVDQAEPFKQVIRSFQTWIGVGQAPYQLCSWGFYDRKQLKKDCELHELDTAWLSPHISVKHQYQGIVGLRRPVGMGKALEMEGMTLEGTHHRGIDDARNISKIFSRYLGKWKFV